jgi:methylmalonyl-CoA mutase N-terminal domain/subunit
MQEEIHRAAYRHQRQIEAGERTVVGVNAYAEEDAGGPVEQPDFRALEARQRERVEAFRRGRAAAPARAALAAVREAARAGDNLLPPMIEAVKAAATLGEISDVLREEWGTYDALGGSR